MFIMNKENRILIKAGGGLVINEKGEILFMFRRGKWDLPKGKLDPGESLESCANTGSDGRNRSQSAGTHQVSTDYRT